MEKAELKALFAKGKYPTESDFAALIDSMGSGSGIPVYTIEYSGKVWENVGLDTSTVKTNDVIIIKNTSNDTINLEISYNSGRTIAVAPSDAVMLINNGSYDEWGVVGVPIN